MAKRINDLQAWIKTRYIVDANGCWIWQGAMYRNGYGSSKLLGTRRSVMAHKISYLIAFGDYDQSLDLDHLCRVRACINPDHLEPVTRSVNLARGTLPSSKMPKSACHKGHLMSGDNVYTYPNSTKRACRACMADYRKKT